MSSSAGDTLGTVHIMLMGEEIGTAELVATQDFSLSWFRKVLGTIGKLLGSFQAPVSNTVGVMGAMVRSIVTVLDAIRKQKEEQASA